MGMGRHMPEPVTDLQYASIVDRTEELARLRAQARRRKSMLVFGPEGVGKTRLLSKFLEAEPFAIYVKQVESPRALLLSLLEGLRNSNQRGLRIPQNIDSFSTPSLKGIAQRTLDLQPFLLVLDHLAGPSRVSTGIIKELNYYDRTPVLFAARSPHMEDIGTLQPMCADRSERVDLKNFPPAIALEFAHRQARDVGLSASNLDEAIRSIADCSHGNPGSILRMVQMAQLPKYRMGTQVKVHVLYLDHLMGRR